MNLVRGGASASPASLFAASEPGVWYDPSQINTLFQDSAGTTPVTAPGQTVGLMLDKSGRGNHATQATSTQRPIYGINPIVGTRNLLIYTEQFDDAIWIKSAATIGIDVAISPDGTQNADKLIETATTAMHYMYRTMTPVNATAYTFSVYAKAAGRTIFRINAGGGFVTTGTFDLSAVTATLNAGTSATITPVGNDWYRCTVSGVSSSTTAGQCQTILNTGTYAGDGTSGIFFWGAQMEVSSTATAYQKVVSQYEVTQAGVQSVGYLSFDGVDDNMVIPSLSLTGTEPLFFCFGAKRLSTTSNTFLMTFGKGGNSAPTYPGFAIAIRGSAAPAYAPQLLTASATASGSLLAVTGNTFGDAATRVVSATRTALRVNASALVTTGSASDFDGWVTQNNRLGCNYNFANNNFWKGNIYSAIFVASSVTTGQITSTETWVNGETGAY